MEGEEEEEPVPVDKLGRSILSKHRGHRYVSVGEILFKIRT